MGRIRRFFCNHQYAPSLISPEGTRWRCLKCDDNGFFVKLGDSVATGDGTHYEADGTRRPAGWRR